MENRIKEAQGDLFADRTSAATLRANQLRLWLASMSYVLIFVLRWIGLAHPVRGGDPSAPARAEGSGQRQTFENGLVRRLVFAENSFCRLSGSVVSTPFARILLNDDAKRAVVGVASLCSALMEQLMVG
jgi:hypothetical protein